MESHELTDTNGSQGVVGRDEYEDNDGEVVAAGGIDNYNNNLSEENSSWGSGEMIDNNIIRTEGVGRGDVGNDGVVAVDSNEDDDDNEGECKNEMIIQNNDEEGQNVDNPKRDDEESSSDYSAEDSNDDQVNAGEAVYDSSDSSFSGDYVWDRSTDSSSTYSYEYDPSDTSTLTTSSDEDDDAAAAESITSTDRVIKPVRLVGILKYARRGDKRMYHDDETHDRYVVKKVRFLIDASSSESTYSSPSYSSDYFVPSSYSSSSSYSDT